MTEHDTNPITLLQQVQDAIDTYAAATKRSALDDLDILWALDGMRDDTDKPSEDYPLNVTTSEAMARIIKAGRTIDHDDRWTEADWQHRQDWTRDTAERLGLVWTERTAMHLGVRSGLLTNMQLARVREAVEGMGAEVYMNGDNFHVWGEGGPMAADDPEATIAADHAGHLMVYYPSEADEHEVFNTVVVALPEVSWLTGDEISETASDGTITDFPFCLTDTEDWSITK